MFLRQRYLNVMYCSVHTQGGEKRMIFGTVFVLGAIRCWISERYFYLRFLKRNDLF